MTYRHLASSRDGAVEHLTLDRPDVRNAFNEALIGELAALQGVLSFPVRIKCALLAWSALDDALEDLGDS